jgi:hypothetical protein
VLDSCQVYRNSDCRRNKSEHHICLKQEDAHADDSAGFKHTTSDSQFKTGMGVGAERIFGQGG